MIILNTGQTGTCDWLICAGLSFFIGLSTTYILTICIKAITKRQIIIISMIATISAFSLLYYVVAPLDRYTYYEVTLDNSVSANEILEKYEVISQRGNIYRIKEK